MDDFDLEDDDGFPHLSPELQLPSQLQPRGAKRTREEMRESGNQSKKTNQTRRKNWNEGDSLLLIEAVTWAEGQKKRIFTGLKLSSLKRASPNNL